MAGFAVQLSLTFSDLNGHSSFSNIRVKYNQLLEGSDQFKHTQKKTKAKNCIPRQIDKPRFSKGVENKVNIVSSPNNTLANFKPRKKANTVSQRLLESI